jgi:iron complex transport system ATP-binding protein
MSCILETYTLAIGYTMPRRPARIVADQIDVTLRAGEFVCLIGPNGAGKSTLMRTLAGMQAPLSGQVLLLGDDAHRLATDELAKRVSVVLTERVDGGMMSAYALVALGRYPYTGWTGELTSNDETVVRQAIMAVGAVELAHRKVDELSDGERQKIMIARALAQEPALMILDEPTAFLDLPRRVEIIQMLRNLAHTTGRAILLSTHDLDLALRTADRIWLLPTGGSLQAGAPEDLILSGKFEAAFRSEGVHFDATTGAFRVQTLNITQVHLLGDGLPLLWTRRALERAGFGVVHNGEPASIEIDIKSDNADPSWQVTSTDTTCVFSSIQDLIAFLQIT